MDQWSSSNHPNLFRVYFEAPTCQSYFNFTNFSFFCLSHGTSIQLLIQLLIQSHVKSAQDKRKCLISALAFAFFCRQRRRILSFIRSKTLFPNFFQTRKRGTNRSYLASNRSNGAQYRFQIFIASPLLPSAPPSWNAKMKTRASRRRRCLPPLLIPPFNFPSLHRVCLRKQT